MNPKIDCKKKHTLCWECEWAGGKDKKCPWATSFKPVPGWNAIPTKIKIQDACGERYKRRTTDSFIVLDCPMFELAYFIKRQIVANVGSRHFPTEYLTKEALVWLEKIRSKNIEGE